MKERYHGRRDIRLCNGTHLSIVFNNSVIYFSKRFGSDLNILPEKNKVMPSSHLHELKMSLPVHRSDNEIHVPGGQYFGRGYYDQVGVILNDIRVFRSSKG